MQTDIDKTMDAILRRARETGFSEGPAFGVHLDADELSLFAENLSPPKARVRQVEHLANCRLCRTELAQLIQLNTEAAETALPVSEAAAPAMADALPWYRKLMLFPNLAYVMGSLVLVFGGLLAVSIYQSGRANEISYSTENSEPERSSDAAANVAAASNDAATEGGGGGGGVFENSDQIPQTGNAAANTIANSNTTVLRQRSADADQKPGSEPSVSETETKVAPPPSQPKAQPYFNEERRDETVADGVSAAIPAEAADDRLAGGDKNKQMSARSPERQTAAAPKKESADEKVVSGKRFIRKQNVWYDVRYTGGPTVNVRRKTPEYQRLDAGVRKIAERLSGTAVIVADGGKAYRISD